MESTALLYAAAGLAALLAGLLPGALNRLPVSMPMVFLGLGAALFWLVPELPTPDPRVHTTATQHLTEATVLVALFGAGLALDRPVGWWSWRSTWRLLGITMPLTMLAVGLLGWWMLGLGVAASLLLAAVLAPTDPVLAADVRVGEPTDAQDSEDEPRFALTSEAGLNDALAFPFVYAALAMLAAGAAPGNWLGEWVAVDLLWRIAAGAVVGVLVGRLLGRLFFRDRSERGRLAERSEGFVALACTFLTYGVAELVEGYGFVAVFVCATTIRAAERDHDYHGVLHGFIEQIERLLTVAVLTLLGGAVVRGLLAPLRWEDVLIAVLLLLVIRPLAGWLPLHGQFRGRRDRAVIAFFGVRGIGSIFYMAYAVGHHDIPGADRLWAITGLVVVLSVLLHGVTATPVMRAIDRRRASKAVAQGEDPDASRVPV